MHNTSTVERLDRPSAYYLGRVGLNVQRSVECSNRSQNKKRRHGQDEPDDREQKQKKEEQELKDATTLYVGNLSFYTTEEQIHELFSKYVTHQYLRDVH